MSARISELRAIERAVKVMAEYIGKTISEITITREMKISIDGTFERFTVLIQRMIRLDTYYYYKRKINVIEKLMKQVKVQSDRREIIDEMKKIYAVVEEMIEITEADGSRYSYNVITRELKQKTSDLYLLLAGVEIPVREKDFAMIRVITPFMKMLVEIYNGFDHEGYDLCIKNDKNKKCS